MRLRNYQLADYPKAALTDGLVLAHDTGLGKTWAALTIPILWVGATATLADGTTLEVGGAADEGRSEAAATTPDIPQSAIRNPQSAASDLQPNAPVLLVAPGDQHDNILGEAATHFRARPRRLRSQADYLALLRRDATGRPALPPGYYLSSYTELCTNGVAPFPEPAAGEPAAAFMARWGLSEALPQAYHAARAEHFADCYATLEVGPDATLAELEVARRNAERTIRRGGASPGHQAQLNATVQAAHATLSQLHGPRPGTPYGELTERQRDWIRHRWLGQFLAAAQENAHGGRPENRPSPFHCTHSPSLADLACRAFTVVVIDEGVRMKGDHTLIGRGVRLMDPAYRLALTGTPIKNRLPDLFWLIAWANRMDPEGTPRWPFPAHLDAKDDFAAEFLLTETNLTEQRRSKTRARGRFTRPSATVCQLHRLYKLLAPNLLRRRKDDLDDEPIVAKHYHEIRHPLGAQQALVYQHHLHGNYSQIGPNGQAMKNVGAQLQALRQAAACPHSTNLVPRHQPGRTDQPIPHRARSPHTPKLHACLTLIRDELRRGRQGCVFSAFHEPLETLARLLAEAGVPCAILNGNVPPARRGRLSHAFQRGRPGGLAVALCGIEACAEGHNWPRAGYVIRHDLSWALDKNEQCVNRVHRLNSPADVDVYDLVGDGTIDVKLRELAREKGDSAGLVLDGRLLEAEPAQVDLAALLAYAGDAFDAGTKTVAEADLIAAWPRLREELRAAAAAWLADEGGSANAECGTPSPQTPDPGPGPAPLPAIITVDFTRPALPNSDLRTPISEPRTPISDLRSPNPSHWLTRRRAAALVAA